MKTQKLLMTIHSPKHVISFRPDGVNVEVSLAARFKRGSENFFEPVMVMIIPSVVCIEMRNALSMASAWGFCDVSVAFKNGYRTFNVSNHYLLGEIVPRLNEVSLI